MSPLSNHNLTSYHNSSKTGSTTANRIKLFNAVYPVTQKRYIFKLINFVFKCIYRVYEFLYGKKKYRSARRYAKEKKYYAALRKPASEKYF